MLLENQQLGRYHIVRLLGSGGMGDVYLAEDVRINQQVAVKAISSEISSPQDELTRLFEREAKAIAQLDHANILPLYDYGKQQIGEMQVMYLVMPYRPEGSLTKWLLQKKSGELLSFQQVVHLILQASEALQHAHSRQIIHQDVKPSNFLIRERESTPNFPDILLADFGIARLASATVNASQSIRGTPTYMAPEQYAGHPVSASDQYALAVMAYELLTGIPPFRGGPMQIMYQHLHDQPQPASNLNPRLSTDVNIVLLHALSKQPEARFASVTAFANALQQAQRQGEVRIAVPQPISQPEANGPPSNSNPPAPKEVHDLRAILAISREEALRGTTRDITLPGGRQISVTIPPGTRSGQEIYLNTRGDTKADAKREVLALTILIKEESEEISSAFTAKNGPTIMDSKGEIKGNDEALTLSLHPSTIEENISAEAPIPPEGAKNALDSIASGNFPMSSEQHSPGLHIEEESTPTLPASPFTQPSLQGREEQSSSVKDVHRRSKAGLLWVLAIVLIIVSIFGITSNQSHMTQVAEFVQETATVQAQIQATTAAVKANLYPAYLTGHGNLASYDSLRPPTQWYVEVNDPNCKMSGNAYHAIAPTNQYFTSCYNRIDTEFSNTEFSNFALEVQMTIVQGDCGGILFRGDKNLNGKFYLYKVCQDRTYELTKYVNNEGTNAAILPGPSANNAAINAGLNKKNILSLVAQGSTLILYINKQQVASVKDGSYTKGLLALIAYPEVDGNPTNVIYSDARIWTF